MQLTSENDKMKMIDIAINPINEFIKSFFNELESNKKNDDNDIGKNALNINGSWGSGKSTIVNNLEYYYQYKNDIEKPKFLIINLWEYETSSNPYYDFMEYIFYNICPDLFTETEANENDKNLKQYLFNLLKKIAPNKFLLTFTDHNSNVSYSAAAEWTKNNKNENINLSLNINNFIYELKNKIIDGKEKYVIIFDEIDRCTVDNQIIFLSYIKNIFFKITNIFFIVSSNNEVINQKLYIENKEKYESKYDFENYTDKLFNNSFDLDIHFDTENLIFTKNKFIKHFLKETNIKNPRLIKKIIANVEGTKVKNNQINIRKIFSEKIEFVIFYIYYLKFNKIKYYRKIIQFSNEIKIKNNDFFEIVKKFIFKKLEQNTNTLSNDDILEWILKNSSYKTNLDIPVNFNFKNIEDPDFLNWDINCECFTFQFLLPFFWYLINNENINTLFNKNINAKDWSNSSYSSLKYEVQLDWNNLNLIKEQKIFLNILKINYYQRNTDLCCECSYDQKNKLTYQNIKEIIKLTIFDYSWNNHLNINNSEVKSEEIQVN